MTKPKITFLMIAFNEESTIASAIDSVLAQTEPDIALYVRNNGSTDRTGEILRQYAARDARVHWMENQVNWRRDDEEGEPFVTAEGVIDIWPIERETLGYYVAFLDADDRLAPDFAEKMLRVARRSRAELTVCGNQFITPGGEVQGTRLPPPLSGKSAKEIGDVLREATSFQMLLDTFRTHWGKLFRTDFFLRHYTAAWRLDADNYLDTGVMLRYLQRCKTLASVCEPLYLFISDLEKSTYANIKPLAVSVRARQAEVLFEETQATLQAFGLQWSEPQMLLMILRNQGFMVEAVAALARVPEGEMRPESLDRVSTILNNTVLTGYIRENEGQVWSQFVQIVDDVWAKCYGQWTLYLRYLARLRYAARLAPDNPLLAPLIIGILCDKENGNQLGTFLLERAAASSKGFQHCERFHTLRDRSIRYGEAKIGWLERVLMADDADERVGLLTERMWNAMAAGQYAEASDAMTQLSVLSPCNRDAMSCRLQLAVLIEEYELAAVLAGTARVLWPVDMEMQQLCWSVFSALAPAEDAP